MVYSSVDGNSNYFKFQCIRSEVAMIIHGLYFVQTYAFITLGQIPMNGMLPSCGKCVF